MSEVMYFGKYKGTPVEDVPTDYLHWMVTQCRFCPMPVVQEYDKRCGVQHLQRNKAIKKYLRRKRRKSRIKSNNAIGEQFAAERRKFLASGGNPDDCPF